MMIRTSLVSASVLLASAPALAADYAIDPAHSFVTFEVSHIGLSTLHGQFNEVAGTFSYDADNPGASSAKVTVPTESLDTNFAERDKHLKSGDFFDVGAHLVRSVGGPEVVYIETMAGDLYPESKEDIDAAILAFDRLRAMALSPDDSIALIREVAKGLR